MTRMLIKPVGDLVVRDRYGRVVPKDGAIDEWSSWWARELKDGAITATEFVAKRRKRSRAKNEGRTDGATETEQITTEGET